MCWRCAQYFVIACGYIPTEIDVLVCIWRMFVYMSVVVTLWGL